MQLDGRVALVTGAGQGIGEAIVRAFAAEGARVCISDVVGERAEALAAELGRGGVDALGRRCDVASRSDVDRLVAEATARFGRIDILVNNAGIIRPAMLHKMSAEQWEAVLAVHLTGSFNCLQAVAPGMMARRYGRIINVTSTAGVQGTIGQINYSAAKAGIVGMTMSAARELAQYGITVNAVAPGAATPMTETIRTDERFRDKYLARIPLGRWAEPSEIAPVFVFFASDAASYVTGQVLAADGGMTIR
ncbi:MAG TPA: 3-oxoacyl-ACP reductase FabG [Casimicrobiaceae bacterium]|nr:3-oxoacyl-ACP reductase FabG [Casimicrobiaceae bacterium]